MADATGPDSENEWVSELPPEIELPLVAVDLGTQPPISEHLARLSDGRYCRVLWNSLRGLYSWSPVSEQYAKQKAEAMRIYRDMEHWQHLFVPGISRADDSHARAEANRKDQSVLRLLNVFTGGLTDERFDKAIAVLENESLTLDQKLTKIDALIPFPPTASASKLGKLFGKSKAAVLKTQWWISNRKGERQSEVGRRRAKHRERAKQYESNQSEE
jgi:hypothetical protein